MLSGLIPELAPYDPIDLLTSVTALQLTPANAGSTIRLEALVHAVTSLSNEGEKPKISASRFKSITRSKLFRETGLRSYEDPFDNAFTEAFTFHGGSYIIFPGILEEPTFILRHLAQAIFLHSEPFPNNEFVNEARSLFVAVLTLSDELAHRASLGRGAEPEAAPRSSIYVPQASQLAKLKQAADFTQTEVFQLLIQRGSHPNILEELITPLGSISADDYTMHHGPLLVRPIVQAGDRLIIALPYALLVALRNELVRRAMEYNVQAHLASRYSRAVWNTVAQSFDYLRSNPVPIPMLPPVDLQCLHEGFFSLDTDKLIYVALVTNPLDSYDVNTPLGEWDSEVTGKSLKSRIEQIERYISDELKPPGGALIVILLESMGLSFSLGFDKLSDPHNLFLHFTAGSLETVALLEGGNHLVLWKYAKSHWKIRERAKIMAFPLEEFDLYRSGNYSYYLSDDGQPDFVAAAGSGGAGNLRRKVLNERDWHAVPSCNTFAKNEKGNFRQNFTKIHSTLEHESALNRDVCCENGLYFQIHPTAFRKLQSIKNWRRY